MTDQPEQLASIIADINQVLARLSGRRPMFASPDWERQKQILERTRAYLLQIQTPDRTSGAALPMSPAGGSPFPASPEADWQRLPSQILQSLQADLERLRQQREALLEEIRALESLRSQQRSLAQQHQAQQQIISEFLQGLTGRLQDNINQQIAQTLARLENQLLAQDQLRDATIYPPTAQSLPLRPTQRVEQLQMLQTRSDQLLMTLDATLRSVFETLQRNIQSYEESLSLGVSNMHNLGQQGEVLFTALVKQLTEQLAQEISQQLVTPNPSLSRPDVLPIAPPPPPRPTTSLPYPEQVSYIPNEEDATIIQNFPYAGAEVIPRQVRQSPSPAERPIEQDLSEFETAFSLDLELENFSATSDEDDDDLTTILQTDPVTPPSPSAENVELDLFYESLFGGGEEESAHSTATSTPQQIAPEQTVDPALDSLEQALFSGLADPADTPVVIDQAKRSLSRPQEPLVQELFAEAWDEEVQRGEDLVRNLPLHRPAEEPQTLDPSIVTIGLLTDLQFEDRISSRSVEPTPELTEEDLDLAAHLLEPLPPDEHEEADASLAEEDSYIPAPPEENLLPLELLEGDVSEEIIRDRADLSLSENRRDLSLEPEILQRLSEDLDRFEFQSQNTFNEFSVEPDLSTPDVGVEESLESQAQSLEFTELASEELVLSPPELGSIADLEGDTPDSAQELLEALTAEINQSSQTLDNAFEGSDLAIVLESSLESSSELEITASAPEEIETEEINAIVPESFPESVPELEITASEPEVITNSLLEEMTPYPETSPQGTESSTVQDFSSELFADSEVVEDFSWSDLESQGEVAQDTVEPSASPDWADVAADPTAPDIFATFAIQEPESQSSESGVMGLEIEEVAGNLTVIQTEIQGEPTAFDLNLETATPSTQIEESWPELTVQDVDLEAEESFDLADLTTEFTAETSVNDVAEDLTVIEDEPTAFDLNLETATPSTQIEENWPELTVQDVDLETEESFDLADVDLETEESFDLADVDLETEESFDLADLTPEFTAETPETQPLASPVETSDLADLAEIQSVDLEDWESLSEPSREEIETIVAPPVSSPAVAADIPEEDLADLMAELATPVDRDPVPETTSPSPWNEDDLAELAAELAAEDPTFQDYIQNQESDELADWSAELAAEDPAFQDNGVLGGHTLSPKDLVTTPEPPPAVVEKKTNSPRPKQVFKSLLNNAQGRARQTKQQHSPPEILPNSSQQGSISQTVAPTPPQTPAIDISGVWYLGIDFGTTGLSAVLLNQITGEHFPIYWHTEAHTMEGDGSFRLPAIAYTGVVAEMEHHVSRPETDQAVDRTESELRVGAIQAMIRSAFAPPLTNPQAGERLEQIKPYLNLAIPYYSPEQKAWQPILQGANQQSFALHWLQWAAQGLLSTLTSTSHPDQLPIGAVGLTNPTLGAVLQRLNGVIVGIPAIGGEAFRFNMREAILGSQLVTQPDQVFFLEDSIATVLAGLTGNALPGVPWRGGTLVMNGGARSIEIALVDLPENLVELHRGNFACRSFEYGGDGIDQDILLHLLAPRLSDGQLSLQTVGAELPPIGVPAPSLRNRWQMVFQQSELGQTLQHEARRLKHILQQQEQVSVTVGDETWEITRQELEQRVLHPWMEHLNRQVNALLVETGMNGAEIRTCVCTGGTTALRVVGKWLRQKLPNAVVIRDRVSLGEAPGLSCTPIAYGLASLPLYPTVLDRLQHQYSDYFLFMEVLRAFPDTPLTLAEITQRLELRGIYTRSCQSRLQALLAGELPRGLVPSEVDAHLLESASAENPDYQRIGQTPLFTKVPPRTYQLNRAQAGVIMRYLQTILRGTAQTLNEPLAIPGSLLALSIQ